jgi:hypothetical protein
MSGRACEDACQRLKASAHSKMISHCPSEISDGKKLPTALRKNGSGHERIKTAQICVIGRRNGFRIVRRPSMI